MLLKATINVVRMSLCFCEAIIRIGSLEHLRNTLKIVENEYIYEVTSLKSSTLLLDKLELFESFFFQGSR